MINQKTKRQHGVSTVVRRAMLHVIAATSLIALASGVCAQEAPAGVVKVSKGTARIDRAGERLPVSVGFAIQPSDRVITGADGSVGITLRDNTLLSVGPNSTMDLTKFSFDSTTHVGAIDAAVRRGTLAVVSGKIAKSSPDTVQFRTPSAILGVRGTEFVIEAGAGADRAPE